MQDHIPDALIAGFERQYDANWNDPQLRNERLAMRYGWAAAMEQIQKPAPATAMDALREAEAALEVAIARILKANPGHSISVTSEAKALVAVRAALAATPADHVEHHLNMVEADGKQATESMICSMVPSQVRVAAAPVVLPEPIGTMSATTPHSVAWNCTFMPETGTRFYTEQQVRALLAPKPAIMPKGDSAAAQLRAMATNYPHGHSWDKLDAKACIRGALEIEALRALLATGGQGQAVASIYVTAGGEREFDDWMVPLPTGRNLLYSAPQQADALPAQVVVDFEKIGAAGPFPISNGRVKLPEVTIVDLARMLKPTADSLALADGMYYLQDARWSAMVGNCPSWWRPDGNGYTTNLDEAARFNFDEAMAQHRCRDTDLPWLCSEVDKLRRPTVDCQYMPRSWDAQRESIAAIAATKEGKQHG